MYPKIKRADSEVARVFMFILGAVFIGILLVLRPSLRPAVGELLEIEADTGLGPGCRVVAPFVIRSRGTNGVFNEALGFLLS